jgi:hypothetical protein
MRTRTILWAVITLLTSHGAVLAQQNSKEFPQYKCRYTLPGPDWSWAEPTAEMQAIFMARNGDGLVLTMSVMTASPGEVIDARFVSEYDHGPIRPDVEFRKRGGKLMTFRGLSSYQHEGILNGRTTVFRVVIANGFLYQLQLLGKADPVERRPDFERILNGFEFTSPPVPHSPVDPHQKGKAVAFSLGKISTYGLLGALFLGIVIQCIRRKFW